MLCEIETRKHLTKDSVPCFVVNNHNRALKSIHQGIRWGFISFNHFSILHIDSHPDLGVNEQLTSEICNDPQELYFLLDNSETGIADFLVPLIFNAHVDTIVWLKPPWARQITTRGPLNLVVGEEKETNRIFINSLQPYFLDTTGFRPSDRLINNQSCTLETSDVNTFSCRAFSQKQFVLDICLDFFSCSNPFLSELSSLVSTYFPETPKVELANYFETLLYLFENNSVKQLERERIEKCESRDIEENLNQKLDYDNMEKSFESHFYVIFIEDGKTFNPLAKYYDESPKTTNAFTKLKQMKNCIRKLERETFVKELFELKDDLCLPHHVSSDEEVVASIEKVGETLHNLPVPNIITIAKSSVDEFDYTPSSQVEFILDKVLEMLHKVYKKKNKKISIVYDKPEPTE
eukprot:snap_masked-scaffold_11-processed-gene-10.40-mRNA-1 protein AED:0.80 eAED:0.80 QI:0/-1/0/1/-1/1/1/0/405